MSNFSVSSHLLLYSSQSNIEYVKFSFQKKKKKKKKKNMFNYMSHQTRYKASDKIYYFFKKKLYEIN